ncbi:hypothetical protein GA0116948_108165 [Chitinophaga costaii]|uniref:Uncharacterized protein n=1 Tax=Chitinophaga costaii TaxID=1335309 RepID=A0A1C4EJR3_9BACT|nr:hypothetical protein GA0116948_108165 [Chitinophaga costaii]
MGALFTVLLLETKEHVGQHFNPLAEKNINEAKSLLQHCGISV